MKPPEEDLHKKLGEMDLSRKRFGEDSDGDSKKLMKPVDCIIMKEGVKSVMEKADMAKLKEDVEDADSVQSGEQEEDEENKGPEEDVQL